MGRAWCGVLAPDCGYGFEFNPAGIPGGPWPEVDSTPTGGSPPRRPMTTPRSLTSRPTPGLAAEVDLDHLPQLLAEMERLRAILWARLTIRGKSPKRLPTGMANAKADRHCGRGRHRLSALRSRMRFRTWWALYGALGRSPDPCLALWPSFCRREVSFSPVPRAR